MIHAGFVTALTFLCWGMQIAVCTLVLWVQNVHEGDSMVNFTLVTTGANLLSRMLPCSF